MLEEPDKILGGLKAIMKAVGAKDAYIGIEDNKKDCAAALENAATKVATGTKIVLLETKYPQGAEKMLIKALIGRTVPLGKLPFDSGVIVHNVATAVSIFEAINYRKPLIERVITVSGEGVGEPKNLRVRIGTTFEDILDQCGGIKQGGETAVISGGPMMGIAEKTLAVPVVKGTSGITVLTAASIKPLDFSPCIRCSRCVEACPMGFMPYRLGDLGRMGFTGEFKDWKGLACIECGCCSFICPAKRPLVGWIRLGKHRLMAAEKPSGD
jgi:electron transport complex protein RnfC